MTEPTPPVSPAATQYQLAKKELQHVAGGNDSNTIAKAQVHALLALVSTLQDAMDRAPGIFVGRRRR